MEITQLVLKTHCLSEMQVFYTQTLEFPLLESNETDFTISAGMTQLTFEQDDSDEWVHHFAFTIPCNQFDEAKEWLAQRTPLMDIQGKDEIDWTAWEAKATYFSDPANNVGEFIARFNLPETRSEKPFHTQNIISVSELGLGVDDVTTQADALDEALDLGVWDKGDGEIFKAIGNAEGMFIVVKLGRAWFPTDDRPARKCPVRMTIKGDSQKKYQVPNLPYLIQNQ